MAVTDNATASQIPTICQVVYGLNFGGAEVLAKEFANEGRSQFRFVFACLDELGPLAEELCAEGYQVEHLGRRPGFDTRCALRIARFCKRHSVNLIHAHQYGPFFYAGLARVASRRIPILYTEHGLGYPYAHFPSRKRIWANRLLLRKCDRVIAVGKMVSEGLIANQGIPSNRIQVVYNGVDLSRYRTEPRIRAAVRNELALEDGDVAVMQIARLDPVKDHPTGIRAIAALVKRWQRVRLILVGEGPERAQLAALVRECGLGAVVRFLGARKDVPRLLQAADVLLLSSVSEGIPLTLIEAMASALPCVATRVGGTPEVVVEGQTGLLAEPSNPEDLATCLEQLVSDGNRRHTMGAAGRRHAQERFNHRTMHCAYQEIYRTMLSMPASAGRLQ